MITHKISRTEYASKKPASDEKHKSIILMEIDEENIKAALPLRIFVPMEYPSLVCYFIKPSEFTQKTCIQKQYRNKHKTIKYFGKYQNLWKHKPNKFWLIPGSCNKLYTNLANYILTGFFCYRTLQKYVLL